MSERSALGVGARRSPRRALVFGALAFSCALVSYELWPTDERRITSVLNDLCAELNQARRESGSKQLESSLRARLEPHIEVRAPEFDLELSGVDAVIERLHEEIASGVPLSFALSSVEVHLSGHLARVDADLLVTVSGSSEQSRDLRHTHVRLNKADSAWRVEAVEIERKQPSEPEARP